MLYYIILVILLICVYLKNNIWTFLPLSPRQFYRSILNWGEGGVIRPHPHILCWKWYQMYSLPTHMQPLNFYTQQIIIEGARPEKGPHFDTQHFKWEEKKHTLQGSHGVPGGPKNLQKLVIVKRFLLIKGKKSRLFLYLVSKKCCERWTKFFF